MVVGCLTIGYASAKEIEMTAPNVIPYQVTVAHSKYKGKMVLQIEGLANDEKALAILKDIDFHNGSIEATISGQPLASAGETERGFVGIVFRGAMVPYSQS